MATKKESRKKARERVRFAAYPFADVYEIQYQVKEDASGKPVHEEAMDGKKKPKSQVKKKKAKSYGQLPWGFTVKDTGERRIWIEKGKQVTYAACCRRRKGGFERRTIGDPKRSDPVWIREDQLQNHPCLEVVFVDIGQGDGCFMVTPNPDNPKEAKNRRRFVIDAGQESNMRHYLNWRHGPSKKTTFEAAIISHPDSDHYRGFEKLFERTNFDFKTVYTNGIMESLVDDKEKKQFRAARTAKKSPLPPEPTTLGPVHSFKTSEGSRAKSYVTELVTNLAELRAFLKKDQRWSTKTVARKGPAGTPKKKTGKQFPTMLNEALEGWKRINAGRDNEREEQHKGGTMGDFRMLSVEDGWLPGYEPLDAAGKPRNLTIQVLGPVVERIPGKNGGKPMLQYFEKNPGKAKNGHSVVLRLQFGKVSMMLGGDLNIPSEHLLLEHHTNMQSPPDAEHQDAFVDAARQVFEVDIAKSCHHGSSDFTHWFLQALNPIATVISSGDDEPHSHPRSDTLGAIGRYSRSNPRPLIFSTELARSTKDSNQKPWELRSEIYNKVKDIVAMSDKKKQDKSMEKLKKDLEVDIPRSVAVYGAITVVTDGEKVIIYQKIERKGAHGDYDIYRLEPSGEEGKGPLMYVSKHV